MGHYLFHHLARGRSVRFHWSRRRLQDHCQGPVLRCSRHLPDRPRLRRLVGDASVLVRQACVAMATTNTGKDELQKIARDAMLQRGLLPDFSPAVIAETSRITQAAAASGAAVRDLRRLLWRSIDNDDSLDLDQLSVAEPLTGGAVKILVAIADVDALVKRDSAIDGHASTNTTSVYTAAKIFPMLPEKLSTNLTSLAEGQERLAIVIEMAVPNDGTVTTSDIYQATVLNRAKLDYTP